jgi:WD40 repeat protein
MFFLSCRKALFVLASVAISHLSTARPTFAAIVTDPALPQQMDVGPRAPLSAIALSKDGKTLVSVATDGEIRWRNVQSGKTLIATTISRSTRWVMLLSDGSFLSQGQGTTISLWEAPKTGQALKLSARLPHLNRFLSTHKRLSKPLKRKIAGHIFRLPNYGFRRRQFRPMEKLLPWFTGRTFPAGIPNPNRNRLALCC